MKPRFFVLMIVIVCALWSASSLAEVKLFVLAGQSNMEGHAQRGQLEKLLCALEEFELPEDPKGCYRDLEDREERMFETVSDFYWTGEKYAYGYEEWQARIEGRELAASEVLRAAMLQPLDAVQTISFQYRRQNDGSTRLERRPAGGLTSGFGNRNSLYGPELSLGHILHQAFPKDEIIILKVVQGGSDLHEQWRSPSAEARLGAAEQESLYPKLISHVRELIDNPGQFLPKYASGPKPEIVLEAFFWFQGFNDIVAGGTVFADHYEANLSDLLNDVRSDLNAADLPVVIGQSAPDSPNGLKVQEAQARVAQNLPHCKIIVTSDLSNYFHFDSGSHIIIGERMGKAHLGDRPQSSAEPILFMPRLTGDADFAEADNKISINEASGQSTGYPDLSLKTIAVELASQPRLAAITISFKCIPGDLSYDGPIFVNKDLHIEQAGAYLRSRIINGGDFSGEDILLNESAGLKTRSCNHFALVIDAESHRNYINGQAASNALPVDDVRIVDILGSFGPWPGELWDIRMYDRALSADEIAELAERCTEIPVPDPPNAEFPKPLCGPYICLWGNDEVDFNEERFQYYLHAQDMVYRHNIFTVEMYPTGRLDEYVLNELAGGRNLMMSEGIVRTFVKDWTFDKPLKRENANFWVHENFHSFQGQLEGATNIRGNKFSWR